MTNSTPYAEATRQDMIDVVNNTLPWLRSSRPNSEDYNRADSLIEEVVRELNCRLNHDHLDHESQRLLTTIMDLRRASKEFAKQRYAK